VLGISNKSTQILKLRRREREMRKWHMQLAHKRYSKGKGQHTPYKERYKNIAAYRKYLQEVQH